MERALVTLQWPVDHSVTSPTLPGPGGKRFITTFSTSPPVSPFNLTHFVVVWQCSKPVFL